ncbi:MAG: hypothetical protein JSU08_16060 [Acidobacteria bacterium]|nr:hypothetical protein [Acidobacteriota bacterium]
MLNLQIADRSGDALDISGCIEVQEWQTPDGARVARGLRANGSYLMEWPNLATYRFDADRQSVIAYPAPGASADDIWDAYRRSVLPLALQVRGWEALHASAIVTAGGLVAFCARSQTGKSTIAFGLRRRGFPQWCDDGLVFRPDAPPLASPLPFEARLRPESRTLFGYGTPTGAAYLGNTLGEQHFTEPLPIRSICLLSRTVDAPPDTRTEVRSVPPADAFTALLTHALEFDPTDDVRRTRMMRNYLDLAAAVPVVELRFVPNRARFDSLLDTVTSALDLTLPEDLRAAGR